jgi:hypothetical protein
MSLARNIAICVDVVLGSVLVLLLATHTHLTVNTRRGGVVVPAYWVYGAILAAIGAATAWWLLSRGKN